MKNNRKNRKALKMYYRSCTRWTYPILISDKASLISRTKDAFRIMNMLNGDDPLHVIMDYIYRSKNNEIHYGYQEYRDLLGQNKVGQNTLDNGKNESLS